MKRYRLSATLIFTLWCLTQLAWATPRVAIVIPIKGQVTLGGQVLEKPKLAEEGQLVSVAGGGEARVQLLNSSKEKVLKGSSSYTINKANLEKDGKSMDRGSVSVASEIGNLSRAGASTARPATYQPVGLAFQWPPVQEDGRWVSRVVTPAQQVSVNSTYTVIVAVSDLTDPTRPNLEATISKPIEMLAFASDSLIVGHQYRVDVQTQAGERGYARDFRILTPQEQTDLQETAGQLRQSTATSDEMPILIRLASTYKSFDQIDKMADVLLEAVKKPGYQSLDSAVKEQLLMALNRARNGLDIANYKPAN